MLLTDCPVALDEAPAPSGPRFPERNALKEGFASEVVGVAVDTEAILDRAGAWYYPLKPQHGFHAWLVDQIAVVTLEIDRCGRIERRLRDVAALRAGVLWDSDRRSEARAIGEGLGLDPAGAVDSLRETPQGCDWLIERWSLLARAADAQGAWIPARAKLAFDLLATPAEFRSGPPGDSTDPAGLARSQVEALRARRAEVVPPDALDRALAEADLSDEPSPELKRLRRRESTLHRRLRWYVEQLQFESPHHRPRPDNRQPSCPARENEPNIQDGPRSENEPNPRPTPEKPPEFWQVRPPNPEFDLETPDTAPTRASRREARHRKSEDRREARRRKLERRRA